MIVCLGWGSLIWRPQNLALTEPVTWHPDGPALPVEFARKSQKSRLVTLVLMDEGPAVPLLWAEMSESLDEARSGLAAREGTPIDRIGCWPSTEPFPHKEAIAEWARAKEIDGVVWTALGPRFDADGEIASAEEIISYLRDLDDATKVKAEEYVRKAPPRIRTPYRALIERELGWTPQSRRGKRMDWTGKKYGFCVNCAATSYPERRRGYCSRCFSAADALRKIDAWDPHDQTTWHGCPYRKDSIRVPNPTAYIERCKSTFRAALERRRLVEARCRGDEHLPSHDVELQWRGLAFDLSVRDRKAFDLKSRLVNGLDQACLRVMYRLLDDMAFLRPTRSLWIEALRP